MMQKNQKLEDVRYACGNSLLFYLCIYKKLELKCIHSYSYNTLTSNVLTNCI